MLIGDQRFIGSGTAEHFIGDRFVVVYLSGVFLTFRGDEAEVILHAEHHDQLAEIIGKER